MNPIKVRILYGLLGVLAVFCIAFTAGGTFNSGSGGGGSSCATTLWDNSAGTPVSDLDITDSIGTVYVGQHKVRKEIIIWPSIRQNQPEPHR